MTSVQFILRHGAQHRLPGALLSVGWIGARTDGSLAVELGVSTPRNSQVSTLAVGDVVDVRELGIVRVHDVLLGRPGERGWVAIELENA